MPDGSTIPSHTCEVLRQVKGAGVEKGGFVCGDALFGSVVTAVMVMKLFEVHSTWIVKNNTSFFPKDALLAVLLARHGKYPAGHWVTFTTEIAGVKLYAMAYAWSQKGVSFILSTCGSTEPSDTPYFAWYQDDFGGATFKPLPRPRMADSRDTCLQSTRLSLLSESCCKPFRLVVPCADCAHYSKKT